jgi:hypothetical protein
MKKREMGLACFYIGLGMVLGMILPVLGWVLTVTIALVLLGLGYIFVKS